MTNEGKRAVPNCLLPHRLYANRRAIRPRAGTVPHSTANGGARWFSSPHAITATIPPGPTHPVPKGPKHYPASAKRRRTVALLRPHCLIRDGQPATGCVVKGKNDKFFTLSCNVEASLCIVGASLRDAPGRPRRAVPTPEEKPRIEGTVKRRLLLRGGRPWEFSSNALSGNPVQIVVPALL